MVLWQACTNTFRVAVGVAIEHPGNENHERGKIASISFWTDRVMSEVWGGGGGLGLVRCMGFRGPWGT